MMPNAQSDSQHIKSSTTPNREDSWSSATILRTPAPEQAPASNADPRRAMSVVQDIPLAYRTQHDEPEQFDDWLSRITRTPIASATADERRRVLDAQELSSLRHIRAAQVDQMARVNEARGLVISVMRSPLMRRIGEMQGFTLSPTPGTDDTSDVERPASVASDSTSDVQRPASILSDGMSMRSSGQSEDMSTDRDSSSSLDGYMSDYMSTSSSPPPSVTPQYPEPSASTSGWAGSSSVSVDVAAQANTVRIAGQKRARSPGSAHNPYILDE